MNSTYRKDDLKQPTYVQEKDFLSDLVLVQNLNDFTFRKNLEPLKKKKPTSAVIKLK